MNELKTNGFYLFDLIENLAKVLLWRDFQEDIIKSIDYGIYLSKKEDELKKVNLGIW